MNVHLASDLHLEFLQKDFPGERPITPAPGADVLVLAGDSGRAALTPIHDRVAVKGGDCDERNFGSAAQGCSASGFPISTRWVGKSEFAPIFIEFFEEAPP